jgi:integrase
VASISKDAKGLRRILFVGADGKRGAVYLGKMPQKAAEAIKTKIEAIVAAQIAGISIDKETAEWIGGRDAKLYGKLATVGLVPMRAEVERATLGAFIDGFISDRSDVKGTTATVYGHTRRCLVNFFGAGKPLAEITPGDADAWRRYLARPKPTGKTEPPGEGLSENTVKRRCGIAKQFFRAAQRRKLIAENPFGDMKGTTVRGNRARDFFVTREMSQRVLDACPDAQWRLLFALSRFGGLRCPSEHLGLRWGDVDWEQGRITVQSPKTEHHEGKESRVIPIFPELSPYLEAVWEQAEPGTEFVVDYRDAAKNFRTRLNRIIRRAGLEPWPKLFQNLRSTRQTELAEEFPAYVVCEWLGNSQAIAREHSLQVTDEHFRKAAQKPTQNPTQQAAVSIRPVSHALEAIEENSGQSAISRAFPMAIVGDEGLEPPTLTV